MVRPDIVPAGVYSGFHVSPTEGNHLREAAASFNPA